jgi:hypothetical protein
MFDPCELVRSVEVLTLFMQRDWAMRLSLPAVVVGHESPWLCEFPR